MGGGEILNVCCFFSSRGGGGGVRKEGDELSFSVFVFCLFNFENMGGRQPTWLVTLTKQGGESYNRNNLFALYTCLIHPRRGCGLCGSTSTGGSSAATGRVL